MRQARIGMVVAVITAAGFGNMSATCGQPQGAPPPSVASPDAESPPAFEALARGPLHEAFASPYVRNPEPAEVIPEAPPEPIAELPPEQIPAGDDITWIPGYWSWDPAAGSYVWVSGLWRHVPPGRRWIPGYWTQGSGGYQWVPGLWADATSESLVYLPAPPPLRSSGPAHASPHQDSFWVPGNWSWTGNDYVWRDGYWTRIVPGWVWIPAQYVWTPQGCVYMDGYWDRTFDHRGVLFAPVVYHQPIYTQPNYSYRPNVVLRTTPLLMHMFASPGYNHYFYGNYYGYNPQQGVRFFPWYANNQRYNQYNPLLIYYQWAYARRNVNLVNRLTSWNNYFTANKRYRPPVTFRAQRQFLNGINANQLPIPVSSILLADSLNNFTGSNFSELAFTKIGQNRLQTIRNASQSLQNLQQQRRQFEQVALQSNASGNAPQQGNDSRTQPAARHLKLPEAARRTAAEKDAPKDQANPQSPNGTPEKQQADQPSTGKEKPNDRRQPGAPGQGPPDKPKPIEGGDQSQSDDQTQPANPSAKADVRKQNEKPGTSGNPVKSSDPAQRPRIPRFGVGPREQNDGPKNRPEARRPNAPQPGPGAEQPNRSAGGDSRRPQGRGPAALNLLPPGAEAGGAAGKKKTPGQRPESAEGTVPETKRPETRPPETDRPNKPEMRRPAPEPQQPRGEPSKPQPRPQPKPDPEPKPKAEGNSGGNPAGPPAAQPESRPEKPQKERRKEKEKEKK